MLIKLVFFVSTLLLLLVACNNQQVVENNTQVEDKILAELNPETARLVETPPQDVVKLESDLPPGMTTEGKQLSIVKIRPIESLVEDGVHDLDNDAMVVLQDPKIAMADFPVDRRKQINWVQALERGFIKPRADLLGKTEMLVMDMDIVMKNTQFMPNVRFPHYQHTKWLACSNCHPKIFIPQEHANPITMNKVLRGEYCGVCHDKVAFALFTCERCHSVPTKESGKWW